MVQYLEIAGIKYPYRFTALRYYKFHKANDTGPVACMDLIYDCIVSGCEKTGDKAPKKEDLLSEMDSHEINGMIAEIASPPESEGKQEPAKA